MHARQYQYAKGAVPQRPVVYHPVSLQRDNTRNIAVVHTCNRKRGVKKTSIQRREKRALKRKHMERKWKENKERQFKKRTKPKSSCMLSGRRPSLGSTSYWSGIGFYRKNTCRSGRFSAVSVLTRKGPSAGFSCLPRAKHASYKLSVIARGNRTITDALCHLLGTRSKTKISDGTQPAVGFRSFR